MRSRIPAALATMALFCACTMDENRIAGGADDHGNAVQALILVTDSTGAPVPNTEVVVRPASWTSGTAIDTVGNAPEGARTWTDSSGYCRIRSLRSGEYTVRAGTVNVAGAVTFDVRDSEFVAIGIYATGGIRGTLPGVAPGTLVAARGFEGVAEVDSSGGFILSCIPAGSVELVVGLDAGIAVIEQVHVYDRKVSVLQNVAGVLPGTRIRSAIRLSNEPLPPVFLLRQGDYAGLQKIRFVAPIVGDKLEVLADGKNWIASTGQVRLGASSCVVARSIQGSTERSAASKACYSIQPW